MLSVLCHSHMTCDTSISIIIISIIREMTFNQLTNTSARVLTQNLAGRQGICFITKYNSLEFHLLTCTKRYYLVGNGVPSAHKFFSSYGLLAPLLWNPGPVPCPPFATPLPETPKYCYRYRRYFFRQYRFRLSRYF